MEQAAGLRLKRSAPPLEFGKFQRRTDFRCEVEGLAVEAEQHAELGVADARCLLQYSLEYGLQLARRTGAGVPGHAGNATRICDAKFGALFRFEESTCTAQRESVRRLRLAEFQQGGAGRFNRKPRHCSIARATRTGGHTADDAAEAVPSAIGQARRGANPRRLCRCSRTTSWSAPSSSTARRSGRSPTSRSSWSELRRPGRHRHREHAPAQRAARIAAAADRHRRRAQGHQPLDLRSADRARYAGRVGGAAVRGGSVPASVGRDGDVYRGRRELRLLRRASNVHLERVPDSSRTGTRSSGERCSKARPSIFPMCWPIRNTAVAEAAEDRRLSAPCSAFRCCAKGVPIGVIVITRTSRRAVHRQADRAGRRPSPTRR